MLMLPRIAHAARTLTEWRLALCNVYTNETFDALFGRAGRYIPDGLAGLNHGLRDWRTNEVTQMDRRLFIVLARLRETLGVASGRAVDLISGYRSPRTNAALRAKGGSHTGVASKSQHMLGKATDLSIPGIALSRVREAAMHLQGGGVGCYPNDGFVHAILTAYATGDRNAAVNPRTAAASSPAHTPALTATKSAPAATNGATLSGVIPPIATQGNSNSADHHDRIEGSG